MPSVDLTNRANGRRLCSSARRLERAFVRVGVRQVLKNLRNQRAKLGVVSTDGLRAEDAENHRTYVRLKWRLFRDLKCKNSSSSIHKLED